MKLRANVRPQWQWAKLKQLLAIVLMFWGTISMYGQSKMISGIVQSESDGEPLVVGKSKQTCNGPTFPLYCLQPVWQKNTKVKDLSKEPMTIS